VLRLRPDIIKLDRDLTGDLDCDRARRSRVAALVLLANAMCRPRRTWAGMTAVTQKKAPPQGRVC
jgi:hypothetical protein